MEDKLSKAPQSSQEHNQYSYFANEPQLNEWLPELKKDPEILDAISTLNNAVKVFGEKHKSHVNIEINGNIGSGKTVLLNILRLILDCTTIAEPVNEWTHVKKADGTEMNALKEFYTNKEQYATIFQEYVFMSRLFAFYKGLKNSTSLRLYERSTETDTECFMKMLMNTPPSPTKKSVVDEVEKTLYMNTYDMWNTLMTEILDKRTTIYLYIRALPETSYYRLKHRNRNGEETVGLDYLNELHKAHEEWMFKKVDPKNLFIIDGTFEYINDEQLLKSTILNIIQSLTLMLCRL